MPLYRYQALDNYGKTTSGIINADCMEMAKERLKKQKVIVTKLVRDHSRKGVLSSSRLLDFTRDVASMLAAGLPLYDSLLIIEEKSSDQKDRLVFLRLCDQVKQGKQLSAALAEFPESFDVIYTAMVTAGEETGALSAVFHQLAKMIAKQQKLKKQVIIAMTYPLFLFVFCIIVVAILLLFLIPSMQELMEGRQLHSLTQIVLSTSLYLSAHKLRLGIIATGVSVACTVFLRSSWGKDRYKNGLLSLPLVKTLVTQSILVRFSRTLGVLLQQSVSLTAALKLAKQVMNHKKFAAVVTLAEQRLVEGKKLSSELAKSPLFPRMMMRMLSTAEEVGKVDQMFLHIADIYEEELEKSLQQFTSLLQPVLLLILGVIVGIVLLAVLLPLTDVSSFL